jgi:hypothetical protein
MREERDAAREKTPRRHGASWLGTGMSAACRSSRHRAGMPASDGRLQADRIGRLRDRPTAGLSRQVAAGGRRLPQPWSRRWSKAEPEGAVTRPARALFQEKDVAQEISYRYCTMVQGADGYGHPLDMDSAVSAGAGYVSHAAPFHPAMQVGTPCARSR